MQVRWDGVITISFINVNTDGTESIQFTTCTPSGAPAAPVCGTTTLVANVAQPLLPNFDVGTPMVNIELSASTYPKHTNRTEPDGKFTTFLVFDDCKSPFTQGNPPFTVCLDAEVKISNSTDGGKTWSSPASVDTTTGHHFYPAIATDASTGIVDIAYYSTFGDKFNHSVRVLRNQINPGGTALGSAQLVTKTLDPIDTDPQNLGFFISDAYLSVIVRGTGASGQSRLYTSFDSTAVAGAYEGRPVPEQNNHISLFSF